MKKIMILAVLLSIVMSVSAQMYTFESELLIPSGSSKAISYEVTLTIKDGSWLTNGVQHIIMNEPLAESDNKIDGKVFFEAEGIDWEGESVMVAIVPEATDLDAVVLSYGPQNKVWYFGKFKLLKQ